MVKISNRDEHHRNSFQAREMKQKKRLMPIVLSAAEQLKIMCSFMASSKNRSPKREEFTNRNQRKIERGRTINSRH
jgi:hypothetical protein